MGNAIKYLFITVLLSLLTGSIFASERNPFTGTIVVEWIDDVDNRKMRLLEEFSYTDPKGKVWKVPKGAVIDGASIPQVFWSFIGPPFVGAYRKASVVHDYFCETKSESWEEVHRMFFDASLDGGVSVAKATTMYTAVYAGGPRWKKVRLIGSSPQDEPLIISVSPLLKDQKLLRAMEWANKHDVSIDEIEKHVDELAKADK